MAYIPYATYMPPMYQQNINNDRLAYLQQYQQQIPQPLPVQPQQNFNQGLLWVQGEGGAKSYLIAPGASLLLMDSEATKFYIKTADSAGVPSMRTFEYKEITQNPERTADPKVMQYATHEDIEDLKKQIDDLKKKLEVKHESIIQPAERLAKSYDESGADANGE